MGDVARLRIGAWEVDPEAGRIRSEGSEIRLEPRLMRVLLVLAAAPGKIITKDELVDAAWDGAAISDDAITSAIYRLRRLLVGEDRPYIETAAKRGYRLVAPVQSAPAADDSAIRGAFDSLCEPSLLALYEARLIFERGLEANPRDGRCAAGLAEALMLLAWAGRGGRDALVLAHTAALNALAADRPIAAAHRAAALTFAFHRKNRDAAESHLAQAKAGLEDRATLRAEAMVRALHGGFEDAIAALDAAIAINPTSLQFGYLKTQIQITARDHAGALQSADHLIDLYPEFAPPWSARGWALHFLGRADEAVAAFRDLYVHIGAPDARLGQFDAALDQGGLRGVFAFAHDWLAAASGPARETDLAFLAVGAGDLAAALGHLRKAIVAADPIAAFAPHLPHLDPLRGDENFAALFPAG